MLLQTVDKSHFLAVADEEGFVSIFNTRRKLPSFDNSRVATGDCSFICLKLKPNCVKTWVSNCKTLYMAWRQCSEGDLDGSQQCCFWYLLGSGVNHWSKWLKFYFDCMLLVWFFLILKLEVSDELKSFL